MLCRMGDNPEIWKAVAMADHFEKIQKLPEPVPGCPNFRRVPGYKVRCFFARIKSFSYSLLDPGFCKKKLVWDK